MKFVSHVYASSLGTVSSVDLLDEDDKCDTRLLACLPFGDHTGCSCAFP